jgi:hypothetical protein
MTREGTSAIPPGRAAVTFGERRPGAAEPAAPALVPTRSGHTTVVVTREDGRSAPLHSRYDPVAEARHQIAACAFGPLDTIVVLGMGLGYGVEALCDRLGPGNHLIVVERDPALFRAATGRPCVRRLLDRPRTFFFVGTEPDALYDFLAPRLTLFLAAGLRLIRHPASFAGFPAYYGAFLKRIEDFVRSGGVALRTAMYLSRVSFTNRMRNLRAYLESPGVLPYRGRFTGRAGVVVSAGPSLARNMEVLRAVRGKAPVVAVSTALKALLGRGIEPDFAVIIDYGRLSRRYFEAVAQAARIPLVCDLKANAGAVAAYEGPKLFGDDPIVNTLLGGIGGPKGQLTSGSTVAHAAYHFACYLGCDPVIFVGQDLAYTDGELHVPGTAVYHQALGEFNRFYSSAMKELEYSLTMRPRLREVPAWGGGTVKTCDVFSAYLEEFEQFFRRGSQRIIDATEGGARKRWTERMPLESAVAQFVREELPPELLQVPPVTEDECRERTRQAAARLEGLLESARELGVLYDRAVRLIRKVLKENRRGRAADEVVAKVLKIKEELKDYGLLYVLMTNLAQSDLFLRLRRDRQLDESPVTGVERQRRQAERDLEYLLGLRNALGFFRDEVGGHELLRKQKVQV